MIYRDLIITEYVNGKLHVPHVSTKKSLEIIGYFKDRGVNVTVEVTPHHLCFTDEKLKIYDTNAKVAPPIRSKENKEALIDGIKNGIIDCIATDHAPHTIQDKETTFDLASFGMIGLESCFGAVNKILVHDEGLDLGNVLKLLTSNPRAVMGFEQDLFSEGTDAEITILDPDVEWTFEKVHVQSRSINSPYYGEILKGKVEFTISRGLISTQLS